MKIQTQVETVRLQDKTAIREKRHRLPSDAYVGPVIAAFTICTLRRQPYFSQARMVEIAVESLHEAFVQYHGHAGVYLFMPDHLHLMLSTQDSGHNLLAMVSGFKQKTAFRSHKAGCEFEWQKDFYDHIVRRNEDYGAQVRYIMRNPVRKHLCEHWEQWPFKGVLGQTWEQLAMNIGPL